MKLKNANILFVLGLAVPALLVFKVFLLPGPLAWGDAPFYSQEALGQLLNEPYAWVNQSIAGLGKVNNLYWIYPISLVYGSLNKFLNLPNDLLIRLVFYFPALLGSLITPILLTRYLGFSKIAQFFTSLVYTFNTSFILLVDGGQVGIALAHGIFPLTLLFLQKLRNNPTFMQFYKALGVFMLLSFADARLAIICLFALLVWSVSDVVAGIWKPTNSHLRVLLLFGFSVLGLSAYWLYPAARLLTDPGMSTDKPLELLSLLNSLFLFQPHWPANEFGKVFPVPFYFIGIPLLVFGSLFLKKKEVFVFAFCFLLFAFLTKGSAPPLGGFYDLVTSRVPLGSAFRDSSKFFIPTILFGGLLIGISIDKLFLWFSNRKKESGKIFIVFSASYLLLLILPALRGQLNGTLAGRNVSGQYITVSNLVRNEPGKFRTVWFPENHPWTYSTFKKPAIDAKSLVDSRPFAAMNAGTFDRFNFLHNPLSLDWFQLLSIKYLVFSGDVRRTLTQEEQYDWTNLLALMEGNENLSRSKKEVFTGSIPVYEVPNIKPRIFQVNTTVFVVGSDNVYEKIKEKDEKFSLANQGFVFLEDGKTDPEKLVEIAADSAILVFNEKSDEDLMLSFLQRYFVRPEKVGRWAIRGAAEFLKWKYELLVQNVSTSEFDYGKGIAFSTRLDEKLEFRLGVPENGEYVLAVRSMESIQGPMQATFADTNFEIIASSPNFSWLIKEKVYLKKGTYTLEIKSSNGVNVINTAALIPVGKWQEARQKASEIVQKFPTYFMTDSQTGGLEKTLAANLSEVVYEQKSPVRHTISPDATKGRWIVFTDSYHSLWKLKDGRTQLDSYPFYSAVNGFYLQYPRSDAEIIFEGQKEVRWGFYYTALSAIFLAIVFLLKRHAKNI